MERLGLGRIVGGNVELVRVVAVYGGRTIWQGRHRAKGCDVEVTVLDAALGPRDSRRVLRFHSAAKQFEQLRSAHAARLFGHGLTTERRPFLVREPLGGTHLEAHLATRGRLSLRDTGRLLLQLTATYGEAHALGLVMGGLSPHDVWLVPADDVLAKLTPTGLVREAVDDWDEHTLRAPEVSSGAADRGADLWALAALAHLALTGRKPRVSRSSGVARALAPSSEVRLWPRALDDWFRLALSPYPEWRFKSAEDMATTWCAALDTIDDGAICFDDEVVAAESLVG